MTSDVGERLRSVVVDGARLRYLEAGSGEPLVLLHGYPQSHVCWRHQIAPLARVRRVIAPDWFGWGESERAPGADCTYDREVVRLARVLDTLAPGPVELAGHDYGGHLALGLAVRDPNRLRRLAILNSRAHRTFPPAYYLLFASLTVPARRPLLRRVLLRTPVGSINRALMRRYVRAGAFDTEQLERYVGWMDTPEGRERFVDFFAGYSVRLRPQLADLSPIRCPTAVIWGDRDVPCPWSIAADLARRLPNATLTRIAGADHYVMEERPAEVTAALLDWLRTSTP
ncbi:alpha/beta hydrolase [Nocardia otitidiscaviarum]|uniref:alpha/beta fold hydrolase n=1 Tax=Nocardia otitidiscaviarum TaxID=1823 RepID=UPI0004A6CE9B|nr:alpha/beta hydrolase [Nocardia otitidiscaviarum]MBF6131689.1 alpha/beta hydrolase [Nocardia otitidiscaviarum]MBF6482821.1 alpha/beta hydrolase [Nocardia otitidiscaviarum]